MIREMLKPRLWLISWVLLTLGLTTLPLVWGWLATPPGQEFTGFLFNANDGNTYLAKMEEGRQGSWVFHLAHTSEQGGPGAVTFVFYLLLGKLAGCLSLSNILVFHLARLSGGLVLLLVSFRFITLLFPNQMQQRFAFRLVCFSAGLGWILAAFTPTPPDFWVAEGYTFQSIFANPHFPVATALLILVITEALDGLENGGWSSYLKAALATFAMGFVHPFLLFTVAGVLGLYWFRLALADQRPNGPGLVGLLGLGLAGTPGPFLTWWGVQHDPLLQQWMQQNQTLTLDPLTMLAGYGLLVPLGLAGVWWVERTNLSKKKEESLFRRRWQLVTCWLIATLILLLLPLNFSRRFVEGIHLPLCCLATAGYYQVLFVGRQFRLREKALVFLLSLSSFGLVVVSVALIYLPHTDLLDPVHSPYLSSGELGAFDWLRWNSRPEEVVLTGPLLGNVLPGRVLRPVFYGHGMETLDASQKLKLLKDFFNPNGQPNVQPNGQPNVQPNGQPNGQPQMSDSDREQLLATWKIKYLVYGWRERQLGSFDPAIGHWLLVYDWDEVQIYRIAD